MPEETIPAEEPRAKADGSSIAVLTEEIRNLQREFRDWRMEVYKPGHERLEEDASHDHRDVRDTAHELAATTKQLWSENTEAHRTIIARLDSLNGWRNKIMGVLAVMGFAAPLSVAAWAVFTR